ncbi:GNAT family N-acetyltransferase [uncultured Amphritea sp.]|uniref:tRNA(Met) cytidine acetyltransferase TmcA n=1 Tax=uncultured Amphritea sp. TaxID=981605 RepID=UPI002625D02D|nr:GNAT family N-acetyltransferase [uncultured Amphritea sp.]
MSSIHPVDENIETLLRVARHRGWRQLVVLSGGREWCQQQITHLIDLQARVFWIGEPGVGLDPPVLLKPVSAKQAHQLLGQESDFIVFDCWSGFNPNGFGQVVGTLIAGGLFVLITPPLSEWQAFDDPEYHHIAVEPFSTADVGRRFVRHLQNVIATDCELVHFAENEPCPDLSGFANQLQDLHDKAEITTLAVPFRTADQQRVVSRCLGSMHQPRMVHVLTADRGRGKSAALGILSATLMNNGLVQHGTVTQTAKRPGKNLEVILTAPSRGAVQAVISMLESLLPAERLVCGKDCWQLGQSRLRFMLPDQLSQQCPDADLLLVDEAAAIPAPVLLSLLEYPRVIFASTLHGYEGTGQGFAVRFLPHLDRKVPERTLLRMQQPVRWAEGDPLERFSYRALLLDAEPADLVAETLDSKAVSYRKLDRDLLVGDVAMMKQLFGLLILAHYRTSPGDLRILLDSPNIEVWAGFIEQAGESLLVATALLAYEGPIAPELAKAITDGSRRPKGQLIPQTLLAHCHIPEAARCRGLRVMRIAVHPKLQRQGIGSALLRAVEQGSTDIDWLGTSFGATADLCRFWQHFDLQLQRLGHNRDKVSGTHAAVMLRGISTAGVGLQLKGAEKARQQLQQLVDSESAEISHELLTVLQC